MILAKRIECKINIVPNFMSWDSLKNGELFSVQKNMSLKTKTNRLLALNEKLAPIRDTPFSERDELKEEIEKTDMEIDNLVYELYGLTEEERQVIEPSVTKS